MNAGQFSIPWDRRTDSGRLAEAGVYFYMLTTGNRRAQRRLVVAP